MELNCSIDDLIRGYELLGSEPVRELVGLETKAFQAVLGMMIDTHCKDTGETAATIANELAEVVAYVNDRLGPFGKEKA